MTNAETQVLVAYEKHDIPPAIIAEQLEWELDAVISTLTTYSDKYNRSVVNDPKTGKPSGKFLDSDTYVRIKKAYIDIGLRGEVESVRERALKFLIELQEGIKTSLLAKGEAPINIIQINQYLRQVREERNRILDVEAEEQLPAPAQVLELTK